MDVLCVVAGSPVVPDPADGGCWSDEVEPAAPAAAAPWSVLFVSADGAGDAGFGVFALRLALRDDVLFAEREEVVVEGAASAGGFAFIVGAGATPLSCGTGTGAAALGAALVSGFAAGGFTVAGFGAGAAGEAVWSVTPGVTGGGAF